jgi:hypothetical protein
MSGNCELGRGLLRREKNATEGGAGRFEKPAPDARAAPPEAHESLIGRKTVEEVPLTGLSFDHGRTFWLGSDNDTVNRLLKGRPRASPVQRTLQPKRSPKKSQPINVLNQARRGTNQRRERVVGRLFRPRRTSHPWLALRATRSRACGSGPRVDVCRQTGRGCIRGRQVAVAGESGGWCGSRG